MYVQNSINFKPIGIVHVDYSDEEIKNSLGGVEGTIEIFPEYEEGLDGIEEFSHIIVVAYLHRVDKEQRRVLKVKPRRLARFGVDIEDIPVVGVFSTNSPHRPNPIAITIVELLSRNKRYLYVRGLDLFDQTPVIDLRPYDSSRVVENFREAWWIRKMRNRLERILEGEKE